jgi:H+-transporting ATPase
VIYFSIFSFKDEAVEQVDFMPFDPIFKRTEGTLKDIKTGKIFKTSKGAPHVLLKLTTDKSIIHKCEEDVTALGHRGIRSLAVAKTDENGQWHMVFNFFAAFMT